MTNYLSLTNFRTVRKEQIFLRLNFVHVVNQRYLSPATIIFLTTQSLEFLSLSVL
jgi:hypothetical protein